MDTTTSKGTAKTIKVSTLVIAGAILLSLIVGFVGGVITVNTYQDNIDALVSEKAQAMQDLKSEK